jgi:hypothetical protein
MINIQNILDSKIIQEPWPHLIVDNVLDDLTFTTLSNVSRQLESIIKDLPRDSDGIWMSKLSDYGFDQSISDLMLDINQQLLKHHVPLLNKFPNAEPSPIGYFGIPKFNYIGPNVNGTIHEEGRVKSLATVIYMFPEQTYGTRLYTDDTVDSFACEIEWKPNRAFIMCNQADVTWHSFHSDHQPRMTLNYYYEKMEYMDYINHLPNEKKFWFYNELPNNKLYITT